MEVVQQPRISIAARRCRNLEKRSETHPLKLLQGLQQVDSPEIVLRSINASTL